MRNNVAATHARVVCATILALAVCSSAHAQGQRASAVAVIPDDTCVKVRKVFVGFNDIAKKGNTKIIPFSQSYYALLTSYFDRGCPSTEAFPLPKPGTDMSLANTAGDVVFSGGVKFKLGEPLLR